MNACLRLGGAFLLGTLCTACSGTTEQSPLTVSGDAGPDATCQVSCASPPPGCQYQGSITCDPPACPPLVCQEASADADAAPDADAGCELDCGPPPPGCHFEGDVTCDPPKCPPIVCDEAGVDAGAFPEVLPGIWLFGWSGGMNHFSWVRIEEPDVSGSTARFLSGADLFANVPIWNCSGAGSWLLTQKPDTIGFNFPPSCTEGFKPYTFLSFQSPSSFPQGAILQATVEDLLNPGLVTMAFKFPASQCNADMTACTDPLQ